MKKTHFYTAAPRGITKFTFGENEKTVNSIVAPLCFQRVCEYYWNLKMCENMKISLLWLIFIVFQRSLAVFMFFKLLAPCLCSSVEHVFNKVFRWYSMKCFENSQKNMKIYWKQKCVAKQKPLRKIYSFLIIILALS